MVNGLYLLYEELDSIEVLNEEFDSETIDLKERTIKKGLINVTVTKGDVVVIDGQIEFTAILTCARCGSEFQRKFTENFHREYILGKDPYSSNPQIKLNREDLDKVYFQDIGIDLAQSIREVILTSMPIAPHCKANCKGVCPRCGQNLNIKKCSCPKMKEGGWLNGFLKKYKQTD